MGVSGRTVSVWAFCRLDAARGPEDLDEAVEALLEVRGASSVRPDAPDRLAAVFGWDVEEMERRTGLRPCSDVAAVWRDLIGAAFAVCRRRALNWGNEKAWRHALVVCAALQFEALGETASSAASFAGLGTRSQASETMVRVFLSSLPLGVCAALAVARVLALTGGRVGTRLVHYSPEWAHAAE